MSFTETDTLLKINAARQSLDRIARVAQTSNIDEVVILGLEIDKLSMQIWRATLGLPGGARRDRRRWE